MLSQEEYAALADFRYLLRRFLRFSEEEARRQGLTPAQQQLLLAIKGARTRKWLTVGEVAERLQVMQQSAVGLVERAARQGLVAKERDPADARRVRVFLTGRGEGLIALLAAAHERELTGLWDKILEARALQRGTGVVPRAADGAYCPLDGSVSGKSGAAGAGRSLVAPVGPEDRRRPAPDGRG